VPEEVVFLVFTSIVSVTALGFGLMRTVSRHLERKQQRPDAAGVRAEIEDLMGAQAETLEEMRVRLADLEERVDFTERMLANRDRERLPPEH